MLSSRCCIGHLGSLLPHVVVPSILAAFLIIPEWQLSGAQAGLLGGSGAAGYMLTVPVLATLTDRIDARKILIAGSAVSALGTLLFGMLATGLWSGALFNAIAGMGFAGAYMPGLKALTDRLAPGDLSAPSRSIRRVSRLQFLACRFWFRELVAEACGLARRIFCHRRRAAGDAHRLLPVAASRAEAGGGAIAGFRTGVQESASHGVRARLRRALFRALRHQDLDRGVLDLRLAEKFRTHRS